MKIIGLCVGLLIGFGACQSHRDTVVGIRAEGIPVPEKVVLSISDSTYEIFPDSLGIVRFVLPVVPGRIFARPAWFMAIRPQTPMPNTMSADGTPPVDRKSVV